MFKSILTHKTPRVIAVAAAGALLVPLLTSSPAQADPRQHTSQLVGVGSDTLTEVTNAFAGEANDIDYTPLHSDAASGRLQLSSWNGLPPGDPQDTDTCIAPKRLLNSFQRPNGSGQGRAALSRALDGAAYSAINPAGDAACNNKSTAGIVDFARASSKGSAAGTNITYVPFARDALDYGYYTVNGATAITDLTTAEITAIFTGPGTGSTIRGLHVQPCDIQSGSGTRNDWNKKVTNSDPNANTIVAAASADCTGAGTAGQVEENHLDQMKARADAWAAISGHTAPTMFVVGHTASSFIAQKNGRSPNHASAGTDIGSVNFTGSAIAPYTITAGHYDANSAFYGSSYGRITYYGISTAKLVTSSSGQFVGLKQIFRGGFGAKLCDQTATIVDFGFLSLTKADATTETTANLCGSIADKAGLEVNS
jgi:hypothetical protein